MRLRHKYTKKLIPKHQEFVNKYVCTRYDSRGLYGGVFFCEDEDIAFVRKIVDYNNPEAWGCVNMAHQLLVPFKYRRIWDYGRFLVARNSDGTYTKSNIDVNIQVAGGGDKGSYDVYFYHGDKYIGFHDHWIKIQGKDRFLFNGNTYIIKNG